MSVITNDKKRMQEIHRVLHEVRNVPKTNKKRKFGLSAMFPNLPGGCTVTLVVKIQYLFIAYKHKMDAKTKFDVYKRLLGNLSLGVADNSHKTFQSRYKDIERF